MTATIPTRIVGRTRSRCSSGIRGTRDVGCRPALLVARGAVLFWGAGRCIRLRAKSHPDKRFYQGRKAPRIEFGINSRARRAALGRIGGASWGLRKRLDKETAGHSLVRYGRFPFVFLGLIPNSFSRYNNPLFPADLRCGFPTARIRDPVICPSRGVGRSPVRAGALIQSGAMRQRKGEPCHLCARPSRSSRSSC